MTRTAPAILTGVSIWAWGFYAEAVRDERGALAAAVPLVLAVGVAAASLIGTFRTSWARCGAWFALLVVGQAAFLQLVVAGPTVGYQHLRRVDQLYGALHFGSVGVLLAQGGLVLGGLVAFMRTDAGRGGRRLPQWPWWLLAGGMLLLSASPSDEPSVMVAELISTTAVQWVAVGNLALIGLSAPADGLRNLAIRLRASRARLPDEAWLGGAAAFTTIVAGALAIFAYQRHPHVPDEVGYLMQAKYFATGALTMPAPIPAAAFQMEMMTLAPDRWHGIFPPGWPMVLALGQVLGAPWLVNPVLAGVNVLLTYVLARELFDDDTAWRATFLLALSPWHLLLAMSFMSHIVATTAALVAAIAIARHKRRRSVGCIVAAGGAVGFVSLVRPLDGVALALALGVWTLWPASGRAWRDAFALGTVTAAVGSLQLLYNRAVTGELLRFPTGEYMDATHGIGRNALGFGPDRGAGWRGLDPLPGHGLLDVLINADLNLSAANVELFGWLAGSFWLIGFVVLVARPVAREIALLGASGAVMFVYSFYWFAGGPDFGARYWFLVLVPWTLLSARGWARLDRSHAISGIGAAADEATGDPGTDGETGTECGLRVSAAVIAASLAALLVFVPWRAIDKYFHYRGMRPDVRTLAADPALAGALVLVRGDTHPDYMSAAVYNRVGLPASAPTFAWYGSAEIGEATVAAFADRPVWVVDGPTLTGGGFEIVAGPLPPGQAPVVQ